MNSPEHIWNMPPSTVIACATRLRLTISGQVVVIVTPLTVTEYQPGAGEAASLA